LYEQKVKMLSEHREYKITMALVEKFTTFLQETFRGEVRPCLRQMYRKLSLRSA